MGKSLLETVEGVREVQKKIRDELHCRALIENTNARLREYAMLMAFLTTADVKEAYGVKPEPYDYSIILYDRFDGGWRPYCDPSKLEEWV